MVSEFQTHSWFAHNAKDVTDIVTDNMIAVILDKKLYSIHSVLDYRMQHLCRNILHRLHYAAF